MPKDILISLMQKGLSLSRHGSMVVLKCAALLRDEEFVTVMLKCEFSDKSILEEPHLLDAIKFNGLWKLVIDGGYVKVHPLIEMILADDDEDKIFSFD